MKKFSQKGNYAFIDSQNLNLGVRSQGWRLDWRKFRQYLRNKYGVSKAYLFIGQVAGNESLYTSLQEAGYILIFKPTLEYRRDGKIAVKGNVDAELVLHTMVQYKNYSRAIIASGDCACGFIEKFFATEGVNKKDQDQRSVETLGCLAWSS
jgi:uncharacterized LabA/DUF88 family protein